MSDHQNKRTLSRMFISLLITLVIGGIWFYISLPAINLHNTSFYSFFLILLLVYILVFMIALGIDTGNQGVHLRDYIFFAKSQCKVVLILGMALIVLFIAGQIISAPIFRASSYHNMLDVKTGDFASEFEEVSFNEIPMLDRSSAQRLGDRKLGELSDMVSQFNVSTDYTQINYKGHPMRVTCLEYGDFFKWFINAKEGLPAYVTVDMVSQEVQVVRTSSLNLGGIHYSPSEFFNRDLNRTLRFHYPTYMFSSPHLEIDEDGQPWWVCPRETRSIGLFGGPDIVGAVLLNACTGESSYYDVNDIPNWVDRVYTADLISQQYDYHGTYANGFINSIIGQKNVTVTTNGYNFVAMNDDVYMYTGITSVSSDQSNIGFLLSNQRTKETTYYSAPGAIEESAAESAEGVVQDLGYTSTFPLLLNIAGQPTYFMSLKDSSDLVKMYAMVNVAQYQLVSTGTTVSACESDYISKLKQHNIAVKSNTDKEPLEQSEIKGTISEIRTAVLGGDSWYYIKLKENSNFYAIAASTDQKVVTLNVGDAVVISANPSENDTPIIEAISISKNGTSSNSIPAKPPENQSKSLSDANNSSNHESPLLTSE